MILKNLLIKKYYIHIYAAYKDMLSKQLSAKRILLCINQGAVTDVGWS